MLNIGIYVQIIHYIVRLCRGYPYPFHLPTKGMSSIYFISNMLNDWRSVVLPTAVYRLDHIGLYSLPLLTVMLLCGQLMLCQGLTT